MDLTASRNHFEASRATTFNDFQPPGIWATRFRAVLDHVTHGAWAGKIREGSRALIGAVAAFFHSWHPLDTESGREAMHRLHKAYDRCDAMAWRVSDACSVAFWWVYDRCDLVLSKIYDRSTPALERTAHGVRLIAEQASARRGLTLAVVVVGLPAVSFLVFAAANWFTDDDPRATAGLARDAGAPTLQEPPRRLSSTLVEPPASGSAVSPDLPKAGAIVFAAVEGPGGDVETLSAVGAGSVERAIAEGGFDLSPLEPVGEDGSPAALEDAQTAAVAETEQVAALTVSAGQPASSLGRSNEPRDDLYPFKPKPRPWGNARADTRMASVLPSAVAAPKSDRSAGAAGTPATSYRVQLAAVRDRGQALKLWESLNRTDSDLLGTLQPDIAIRTNDKNQRIYRLQAGPLNSKGDAAALCSALEKRQVDCLAIKAGG